MKQTLSLCVKDSGGGKPSNKHGLQYLFYICICMYRTIYPFIYFFLKRTVQKKKPLKKRKLNTNLSIHTFLTNRKSIKYEKGCRTLPHLIFEEEMVWSTHLHIQGDVRIRPPLQEEQSVNNPSPPFLFLGGDGGWGGGFQKLI